VQEADFGLLSGFGLRVLGLAVHAVLRQRPVFLNAKAPKLSNIAEKAAWAVSACGQAARPIWLKNEFTIVLGLVIRTVHFGMKLSTQ
jgi:hypothetical protein